MIVLKAKAKSVLATLLIAAMLFSMLSVCCGTVSAAGAVLTDPQLQYFTGDDFNDAEAFSANWNLNGVTADKWALSKNFPAGWNGESESSAFEAMLASANGYVEGTTYYDNRENGTDTFAAFYDLGNAYITPANWSDSTKPLSLEMDFRLSPKDYTNGELPAVSIPLAISAENTEDTVYLSAGAVDAGHGYTTLLSIVPNVSGSVAKTSGMSGNGHKLIVPQWGEGSNLVYASGYSWTHIKAVYDYSQWTDSAKVLSITVTATVYKAILSGEKVSVALATSEQYSNTRTYTVTFPETTTTLQVGFGGSNTNQRKINIDNYQVTSTSEKVQEFYDKYSAFLSRDTGSLTEDDYSAFSEMYADFAALESQSKAQLSVSGINDALVNSFVEIFKNLCGNLTADDFSDAFKTAQWWNNVSGTTAAVTDTYQDTDGQSVTEQGNTFLKITNASNTNAQWISPKTWAVNERPVYMSFKFRREYGNTGTAYLCFAYSADTAFGAGVREWNDGGTNQPTLRAWTTTNSNYSPSDNSSKILSHQNAHNNYVMTYDQWMRLEAVYDWSAFDTNGTLKITYSIPEIGGEPVTLKDQTITYTFADYTDAKTLYPAFYTDGAAFDIDDVVIETNMQSANEFKAKHAALLAKATVTEDDLVAYLAAYNDYVVLDASSLTFLTEEKAKLDAFKATFEQIYAEQKFTEETFDYSFVAEQFFTASGNVSYSEVDGDAAVAVPGGVTYALKEGKLEGKPLSETFTFRFGTGNGQLVLMTEGANQAQINFNQNDGGYFMKAAGTIAQHPSASDNDSKMLTVTTNAGYVNNFFPLTEGEYNYKYGSGKWDVSKMTTLTVDYDYTQLADNKIIVKFSAKVYGYHYMWTRSEEGVWSVADIAYTPDWVIMKDFLTVTYTVTDIQAVDFTPKFIIGGGTTEIGYISVNCQEQGTTDLKTAVENLVVTPATLATLESYEAQYADLGYIDLEIEAALQAKAAEAAALRPTTSGGTIKITDDVTQQNLRTQFAMPTAASDGFTVVGYGVLFIPEFVLGAQELTRETESVADGYTAVEGSAGLSTVFYGTLSDSALTDTRCSWTFASRAYVVYKDDATDQEYTVYCTNSGDRITDGTAMRSIYGIARKMANAVLTASDLTATIHYTEAIPAGTVDITQVADADVLAFVTANVAAVNEVAARQ